MKIMTYDARDEKSDETKIPVSGSMTSLIQNETL